MGLVVKLALCLAWFYEAFFLLLSLVTATTIFFTVGLHPILVLAYLTLLPYIFFLGILPARTLRKAINSGQPNRMLWWIGATWVNFGMHVVVLTYISWTDDKKPLRTTYSTPLLTVTTIIIVVSQAVVLSAYCSLRRAVPWQAKWDFPTMEEGARVERRNRRSSGHKMKEEKGEHWKRPRWEEMKMEEEMWRQHSEDKRRRREEEAKRRRSEAARQERREGGGEGVELEGLDEVSRVLSSGSHHHVLKIGQGATGEEVRAAYRQLALLVHPDKNKDPRAGEAFAKLQKAYKSLSS